MNIKKLFKGISKIEIKGPKEMRVMGLCADSRRVAPGDLFIAKRGKSFNGCDFIAEAILAGATSVLTDIYNPFLEGITQVIAKDVDALESLIAARFYEEPSHHLTNIGVTGTNGKTTVSYLLRHLLESEAHVGLISTIETSTGKHKMASELTTPDAISIHKLQREMKSSGCEYCVMEVTSIGLVQARLKRTLFDRLLFTNFSEDHLDAHGSMENYLKAKQTFFNEEYCKEDSVAIVHTDLKKEVDHFKGKVITFGLDKSADCFASDIHTSKEGCHFMLHAMGQSHPIDFPMIGEYNILNALCAVATLLSLKNIALSDVAKRLKAFQGIVGRVEQVQAHPFEVFVDFAHTPDALFNVLSALKKKEAQKIVTVFGAGGNRDEKKRPLMGEVVCHLSDVAIITSDNPRTEDPQSIIDHIRAGMEKDECDVHEIVDRRAAIEKGIELCDEGSILLIAGRGHERGQVLRHRTIDFDDVSVVKELLGLSPATMS